MIVLFALVLTALVLVIGPSSTAERLAQRRASQNAATSQPRAPVSSRSRSAETRSTAPMRMFKPPSPTPSSPTAERPRPTGRRMARGTSTTTEPSSSMWAQGFRRRPQG
jgi:cytoskeletal protein RodZ